MTQIEPDAAQSLALIREIMEGGRAYPSPADRVDDLREVVRLAEELALAHPSAEDLWGNAMFHAAWAEDDLYDLTGDPAHLDREIEYLVLLRNIGWDAIDLLVDALSARQGIREDGSLEDIDEALRLHRALPAADEDAHHERAKLGLLVAQRFRASPPDDPTQFQELAEAMELLTEVEPMFAADDPDRAKIVTALGHLHVMSHLAPRLGPDTQDSRDLDLGIDLLRTVAWHPEAADRLAFALDTRHTESASPADRDEAIGIFERLCAELPGYMDDCVVELGTLYLDRLEHDGTQASFERTVECLERALLRRDPELAYLNVFLVEAYLMRWQRVPPEELVRLAALCAEMTTSDDDPFWSDLLHMIAAEDAVTHDDDPSIARATAAGLMDLVVGPHRTDLDTIGFMGVLCALIAQLHGAGWPWPGWSPFTMLAKPSSQEHDLFEWLTRQGDRVPAGSSDHPWFVGGLALYRRRLSSKSDDTGNALEHAHITVPHDHPLHRAVEYELGSYHLQRISSDNGIEHADRAIALLTSATNRFDSDDPARAMCLATLGATLISAYTQGFADLSRLQQAEDLIVPVLDRASFEPEFHAMLLTALGQVRGLSWVVDQSTGDMSGGLALHAQALSLLPADAPLRLGIRYSACLLLTLRSQVTRNLDDAAAAEAQLTDLLQLVEESNDSSVDAAELAAFLRAVRLARLSNGELVAKEDAEELDELVVAMTAAQTSDSKADTLLLWAEFLRSLQTGDTAESMRIAENIGEAAAEMTESMPFRATLVSLGKLSTTTDALLADDEQKFQAEVKILTEEANAEGVTVEERARLLFLVGGMWRAAHTKTKDVANLDRAIGYLKEAHELARATVEPFGLYAAEVLTDAFWARRRTGDFEESVLWGFTALRERARRVLLHEEVGNGASVASTIAGNAHALALRCVAIGRPGQAIAAIEGGRGLAMNVATAGTDVGLLLRELGHETTALEWEHSLRARTTQQGQVPTDLRFRVLNLLSGTAAENRLLSPPTPSEVAVALRETAADAIVYLVPAVADAPGCALFVTCGEQVGMIPLPLLTVTTGGEVDRYLAAHREATTATPLNQEQAVQRWRAELGELVHWAWTAVVGPVLNALPADNDPPRLVLVPCGALGVVPWHAARCDGSGSQEFALARAIFSYAASARQLCDVATRPERDLAEAPVVVADPTGDLFGSGWEAEYLYRHRYPDGLYLGAVPTGVPQDGAGDPDDVLAQLPDARSDGASLLHLACHATTGSRPEKSAVELADGMRLTVGQVLRHARGRPRSRPGGLVVLAACRSDLTDRDHDEVLTLATAFLAAGAGSVVGTRWAVDDRRSAVLMCLFHRFLAVDGLPPADALRAMQLWALDPNRQLPADIATTLGIDRIDIPMTTWAAFTHQGR